MSLSTNTHANSLLKLDVHHKCRSAESDKRHVQGVSARRGPDDFVLTAQVLRIRQVGFSCGLHQL